MSKPPIEWFKKHGATDHDWDLAVHFVNSAQGNPPDSVAEVALTALLAQVRKEERRECAELARKRAEQWAHTDRNAIDGYTDAETGLLAFGAELEALAAVREWCGNPYCDGDDCSAFCCRCHAGCLQAGAGSYKPEPDHDDHVFLFELIRALDRGQKFLSWHGVVVPIG